ncbi:hypothetical protein D3C87_1900280 [compost metagenome]
MAQEVVAQLVRTGHVNHADRPLGIQQYAGARLSQERAQELVERLGHNRYTRVLCQL